MLVSLLPTVLAVNSAWAQTLNTVYVFTGTGKGEYPADAGTLVVSPNGDLYGTAQWDAEPGKGRGTVFRVTPSGQQTVIDYFSNNPDGKRPFAGLIADKTGNLYGTTWAGGAYGGGIVFKLTPPKPGLTKWTETILYSFQPFSRGLGLTTPLLMDAAGNLYGSAPPGAGQGGGGIVFKLDTKGNFTVLHEFDTEAEGEGPGGLVIDPLGNLYGIAGGGLKSCNDGAGCGVVFKLSPSGQETVLYTFTGGSDGAIPSSLILDAAGKTLYGTTLAGGNLSCSVPLTHGCGVVFELDVSGETVLHSFDGTDGLSPYELRRDAAGNLYGATTQGGDPSCVANSGCGVLFKLDTANNFSVLYAFGPVNNNGSSPGCCGGLALDSSGNLFGVTEYGGDVSCNPMGCGTMFELTPAKRAD